jgi:TrmH family RNA methyltransferase
VSALAYRHPRVQWLRRLISDRDVRQEEGRVVLEGAKLLEEALGSGVTVEAVFVDGACASESPILQRPCSSPSRGACDQERLAQLVGRCYASGARVFELEAGVIGRVAATVTPQPLLAVAKMPNWSVAGVAAGKALGLVVVCAELRDPGNLGTVIRSACAAGADAVICCQETVDPWNPKALRSAAGASLRLPVVTAGAPAQLLDELKGHGLQRFAAVPEGGVSYDEADLAQPFALVLGNEAGGLRLAELEGHLDGLLSIPMAPGAESLNVGSAGAVLAFEAMRQRRRQAREGEPGAALLSRSR